MPPIFSEDPAGPTFGPFAAALAPQVTKTTVTPPTGELTVDSQVDSENLDSAVRVTTYVGTGFAEYLLALEDLPDDVSPVVENLTPALLDWDAATGRASVKDGVTSGLGMIRFFVPGKGYTVKRISISAPVPIVSTRVLSLLAGTLGAYLNGQILSRLDPAPSKANCTYLDGWGGTAPTLNGSSWVVGLNLSARSYSNSHSWRGRRPGTAVTPRHLVFSSHVELREGMQMEFSDGQGNYIMRRVSKLAEFDYVEEARGNGSFSPYAVPTQCDFGIAVLDGDLPSWVDPFPVPDKSVWNLLSQRNGSSGGGFLSALGVGAVGFWVGPRAVASPILLQGGMGPRANTFVHATYGTIPVTSIDNAWPWSPGGDVDYAWFGPLGRPWNPDTDTWYDGDAAVQAQLSWDYYHPHYLPLSEGYVYPYVGVSGSPILALVNGSPVMLSTFSTTSSGPQFGGMKAAFDALIAKADARAGISTGYTVTEYGLGNWSALF